MKISVKVGNPTESIKNSYFKDGHLHVLGNYTFRCTVDFNSYKEEVWAKLTWPKLKGFDIDHKIDQLEKRLRTFTIIQDEFEEDEYGFVSERWDILKDRAYNLMLQKLSNK